MRTWPDRNGSAIGRYLRQRRMRHPQTRKLIVVCSVAFRRLFSDVSAHRRT
jgi:hypothetical protein